MVDGGGGEVGVRGGGGVGGWNGEDKDAEEDWLLGLLPRRLVRISSCFYAFVSFCFGLFCFMFCLALFLLLLFDCLTSQQHANVSQIHCALSHGDRTCLSLPSCGASCRRTDPTTLGVWHGNHRYSILSHGFDSTWG